MDRLLGGLDAVRRRLLRLVLTIRPLRAIFADPRRRIPAAGIGMLLVATLLALWAPLISLWLGAAVLGVPHVVSGVRHVALRRQVARLTWLCTLGAFAVGVAQLAGAGGWAVRAFVILFGIAAAAEILTAEPRRARPPWLPLALLIVTASCTTAGLLWPMTFLLVMAHLHALCSVTYFALQARRRRILLWPVLVPAAALCLAAAVGVLDPLMPSVLWAPQSAAASIVTEATGVITKYPSAILLRRILFLYAFGQSLHLAVWMRLIPEVDRQAPVPQTFRRAFALLQKDLGRLTLPAVALCVLALPIILLGGGVAREVYFALTYFHIGLEAAALAGQAAHQ